MNSHEYLKDIESIFECRECGVGTVSLDSQHSCFNCNNCKQKYAIKENVVDALVNISPATQSELKGTALENNISEENYLDVKVRKLDKVMGIEEKQKLTENDHSNYYKQTQMHYAQALGELSTLSGLKVLEIGSCHDYYFLKKFRDAGSDCYGLNIYFNLVDDPAFQFWPKKIIADMNSIPFKESTFDVIIISATSHHSVTPEILVRQIYRVLKPGGKCLMINDPTWGIIKNLGGPDNTKAFRESHINENEYSIYRYNKMFREVGFSYKHLFSSFYDEKLQYFQIHPNTRFAVVAKIVKKLWSISLFRNFLKRYALWFAQSIFGFPMNVVLTKS